MKIAIISNSGFKKQVEHMLKKFEKTNKFNFNILFYNIEKIFDFSHKTNEFNLAILHHSIECSFAFELAVKIRKNNPKCKIIFASTGSDFAVDGYKIDLSYYLMYPFSYEEFCFAIQKCLKNLKPNHQQISVSSNWQKININLDSIQYAEKIGHNVVIHTEKQNISTRSTFTNFLQNFKNSSQFVNCVRGALVNLNWVEKLEPQNFLMKTGNRISIRRKDRKKIKQLYNDFLANKNSF